MTTAERDFLEDAPTASGSSRATLMQLMALQNDYLQDIAQSLRIQNSNVLATAVVKGTSQLTNAITDLNSHEVTFQISGKPIQIHKVLLFSTYTPKVTVNIVSPSGVNDGIAFSAGTVLFLPISFNSLWVQAASLTGGNLPINGPSGANGGFYLFGWTIPDYSRIRGAIRSDT